MGWASHPSPTGADPPPRVGAQCCSRRSSSASSSRSCSSGPGSCGPIPAAGSCSCWWRATSSTAGGTGTTASCSPLVTVANQIFVIGIAEAEAPRGQAGVVPGRRRRQRRRARLLQVLRLLRRLGHERLRQARHPLSPPLVQVVLPDRHLVLHLPGDELRDRRLPGQPQAGQPARLRRLPVVLPAPRRRADRAGRRVPAAAPPAPPTPATSRRPAPSGSSSPACSRRSSSSSFLASAIVDQVFAAPGNHSSLEILFAIYGYAVPDLRRLQRLHRHRHRPARCCSASASRRTSTRPTSRCQLQDFWRRWHMTLSRWLRDYLYISLGGNRGGRWPTYRNLMLTMLIGGLWHGAVVDVRGVGRHPRRGPGRSSG